MNIDDGIITVKGIGDKTASLYSKLGINTIGDLIRYYPRTYKTYSQPVPVSEAAEGETVAVLCKIVTFIETKKGRRLTITSLTASDGTGAIRMVWFNSPFIANILRKGETYVFVGNIKVKGSMRIMEVPEYYTQFNYQKQISTWQPIYNLTAGLTNNAIKKSLLTVKPLINSMKDPLPDDIREKYGLMGLSEALEEIHFPENEEKLKMAVRRLAFDEFLEFLLNVRKMREENVAISNEHPLTKESINKADSFIAGLPYELTQGQKSAVEDIIADMSSEHVMNRLIQGDVGSGKTIVAAIALYMNALSGYQGALMVPTEVLAKQHFNDLSKLFKPLKVKCALLTGEVSVKEKRLIYKDIEEGKVDIVIGTHALIQDVVKYKNLGLVITDEQHRFGVKQREKLHDKGDMPHTLIMSATPIPRTLAIILYADLDISVIKDMPAGRKRIKNCVVGTDYRPSAYKFITKQVRSGHQAYVICPMVEDSEKLDAENVIDYADELRDNLGNGIRIEVLHGKMKDALKNEILERFINKEIDVLVSTTVIEVGINNPNATVMMIENAERFGLAQLHQLRGRVGRGDAQSYAIFINVKKTEETKDRLKCMEESNDGFYIAAQDLKLRGPGDFFGVRQSGELNFHIADIYNHADMLKLAQEVSLTM